GLSCRAALTHATRGADFVTSEQRLLVEPSDIEAIELLCDECGASVSLKPSDVRHLVGDQCPNCDLYWYKKGPQIEQATKGMFMAIRTLASYRKFLTDYFFFG